MFIVISEHQIYKKISTKVSKRRPKIKDQRDVCALSSLHYKNYCDLHTQHVTIVTTVPLLSHF